MFNRFNKFVSAIIAISMLAALFLVPGSTVLTVDDGKEANYIVQGTDAEKVSQIVEGAGGIVVAQLEIINAVGAYLPPAAINQLMGQPELVSLHPNLQVELVGKKDQNDGKNDPNSNQNKHNSIPETNYPDVTGADIVWQDGITGDNVSIAVVDTGISEINAFRYRNQSKIIASVDFVRQKRNNKALDQNGHGTHVASIIANNQIGPDEEWNGVAPGVNLVNVRVLDKTGAGNYVQVIQGIEWVIKHKDQYNIRVMNLSIVANAVSPYWADPLNQAVTRAWAEGIVVVTAAGNNGSVPMSIGVPGNNPYVITVGAFTDNYTPMDFNDDYIAPFSSTGPTLDGFVKPDVVAPGAHMVSLMDKNTYLVKNEIAQYVAKDYYQLAGTSQATAVVSGITALMLSDNPDLTPDQVKLRLMQTSLVWVDPDSTEALYSMWQQGAGRVNAVDAVNTDVEDSANAGMDIWADLAGDIHYEGYSYYDETEGVFKLHGDYDAWSGGYGVWSGSYGVWSGGYGVWSGSYGVWSGSYGVWSGSEGVWNSGYGVWSGSYGVWSGSYGVWSGGYGVWSGGYGVWSGSEPWAESLIASPSFVQDYIEGIPPDPSTTTASIGITQDP